MHAADLREWYTSLLFDPTPLLLQQEQRGRVQIYDDRSDVELNRALDE